MSLPLVEQMAAEIQGKYLTVTGADAGQCTAVAHRLSQKAAAPIVYGDAAQTLYNADHTNYDVYKYSPGMVAPSGAILVYKANNASVGTGAAGHTAVVTDADASVTYGIEQNYPTGTVCKRFKRSYAGVDGWFIPKSLNKGDGGMTPTEIAEIRLKQLNEATATINKITEIANIRLTEQNQLRNALGLSDSTPWSQVVSAAQAGKGQLSDAVVLAYLETKLGGK